MLVVVYSGGLRGLNALLYTSDSEVETEADPDGRPQACPHMAALGLAPDGKNRWRGVPGGRQVGPVREGRRGAPTKASQTGPAEDHLLRKIL
jgi:hypothetical protein